MAAAGLPDLFGGGLKAVLLDLDGVVTATAQVHAKAWQRLFDGFLERRAGAGEPFEPFRLPQDYVAHVDGRPRYDGVQAFLRARDIDLPWGEADDPPSAETVCGLGNRKNQLFNEVLDRDGVEVFEGTIALIEALRVKRIKTACVSSSRNCRRVLERAGLMGLFDVVFDGSDLAREGLPGKPRPDAFLRAAALLGVSAAEAAVVEDAVSGVTAGRAGGFALVIGVDRGAGRDALLRAGADIVVDDLAALPLPIRAN
jgi:trehalose 6-phosphate phosphatase